MRRLSLLQLRRLVHMPPSLWCKPDTALPNRIVFRCHNMHDEGGQKSGHPWQVLSAWAAPEHFAAYVRNPQAKNPRATMPRNPGYDDATIRALTACFQTFRPRKNHDAAHD
jgi:hypothetical protein